MEGMRLLASFAVGLVVVCGVCEACTDTSPEPGGALPGDRSGAESQPRDAGSRDGEAGSKDGDAGDGSARDTGADVEADTGDAS